MRGGASCPVPPWQRRRRRRGLRLWAAGHLTIAVPDNGMPFDTNTQVHRFWLLWVDLSDRQPECWGGLGAGRARSSSPRSLSLFVCHDSQRSPSVTADANAPVETQRQRQTRSSHCSRAGCIVQTSAGRERPNKVWQGEEASSPSGLWWRVLARVDNSTHPNRCLRTATWAATPRVYLRKRGAASDPSQPSERRRAGVLSTYVV